MPNTTQALQRPSTSLLDDPRWLAMVERYAFDPVSFMRDAWGFHASFELAQQIQCRDQTNNIKSDEPDELMVMLALHHLVCFYQSNVYVTGPKLTTVKDRFWSLLGDAVARLRDGGYSWLAEAITMRADRVFVAGQRHQWFMATRTASRKYPEYLAGANNRYLLWIVVDAAFVDPDCIAVIKGSLCYDANRLIMSNGVLMDYCGIKDGQAVWRRRDLAGEVAANG